MEHDIEQFGKEAPVVMNLYLLRRAKGTHISYEEYDGVVVVAESEEKARLIYPATDKQSCAEWQNGAWVRVNWDESHGALRNADANEWGAPSTLHVQFLGVAAEGMASGVVLASNTGS